MARQSKNTVDYFPHNVHAGKTLFILENKYGNDGYAFWFKTLEMLGSTENHFIDCRDLQVWEFLLAKTRVNDETANNILTTLTNLNAINILMWQNKIIYSDNFVSNIADAYKRRNSNCMQFEILCKHLGIKCKQKPSKKGVSADINPQSKVKYSKVNEIKETPFSKLNTESFITAYNEWISYHKQKGKSLTQFTVDKQLLFLSKQPDPIACIDKSIQSGWQGLFEVKTNGQSKEYGQHNNGLPPQENKVYKAWRHNGN